MTIKFYFSILCFLYLSLSVNSQVVAPYHTDFTQDSDDWKIYSTEKEISINSWEKRTLGMDSKGDSRVVWATTAGLSSSIGSYALESPTFLITDTSVSYVIEFEHYYELNPDDVALMEYQCDSNEWVDLRGDGNETNGWNGYKGASSQWERMEKSIDKIVKSSYMGEELKIRFRFVLEKTSNRLSGWKISQFEFHEKKEIDLIAGKGNTFYTTEEDTLLNGVWFDHYKQGNLFNEKPLIIIETYISEDTILDLSDEIVGNMQAFLFTNRIPINLVLPHKLAPGTYQLISKLKLDEGVEMDESNNISITELIVLPLRREPILLKFDEEDEFIFQPTDECCEGSQIVTETNLRYGEEISESPYIYFSGDNCSSFLNLSLFDYGDTMSVSYLYSVRGANKYGEMNIRVDYKNIRPFDAQFEKYWGIQSNTSYIDNNWGFVTYYIPTKDVRQLQLFVGNDFGVGYLDDLYIGKQLADIICIDDERRRFYSNSSSTVNFEHEIWNIGSVPTGQFNVSYYLSSDSIFDVTDQLLAQVTEGELSRGEYRKVSTQINSTTLSNEFFIFVNYDSDQKVEEMREDNNLIHFKCYLIESGITNKKSDFNSGINNWTQIETEGIQLGRISSVSGIPEMEGKAFEIKNDKIKNNQTVQLYSPIYDLTNFANPTIALNLWKNSTPLFGHEFDWVLEFTIDHGKSWYSIPKFQNSKNWNLDRHFMNWFQSADISWERNDINQELLAFDSTSLKLANIKELKEHSNVQFRFQTRIGTESIDVHILLDNFGIIEGDVNLTKAEDQMVSLLENNSKLHFELHLLNDDAQKSDSTTFNAYLSTSPGIGDEESIELINRASLQSLLPKQVSWLRLIKTLPTFDITKFTHLKIVLDPDNLVNETNELDNEIYYKLNTIGINQFPYTENFNDFEPDGWIEAIYDHHFDRVTTFYPHHTYKGGRSYHESGILQNSGQFSNSIYLRTIASDEQALILESPLFDVSEMKTILLNFDLKNLAANGAHTMVNGNYIMFSKDSGESWEILGVKDDPNSMNWYTDDYPAHVWDRCDENFLPRGYNLTELLKGEKTVKFRFHFGILNSCSQEESNILDNFRIAEELPYIELESIYDGDTIDLDLDYRRSTGIIDFPIIASGNVSSKATLKLSFSDSNGEGNNVLNWKKEKKLSEFKLSDTNFFKLPLKLTNIGVCDSIIRVDYKIVSNELEIDQSNNSGHFFFKYKRENEELKIMPSANQYKCGKDSVKLESREEVIWIQDDDMVGFYKENIYASKTATYKAMKYDLTGCPYYSNDVKIEIRENPEFEIETLGDPILCANDTVTLVVNELANVNWFPFEQNDSILKVTMPGEYLAVITRPNGCINQASILIDSKHIPVPAVIPESRELFCHGKKELRVDPGDDDVRWSNGETTNSILVSDGIYWFEQNTQCGWAKSDAYHIQPVVLIDSIINDQEIILCTRDTINIKAWVNDIVNTDIQWYLGFQEEKTHKELIDFSVDHEKSIHYSVFEEDNPSTIFGGVNTSDEGSIFYAKIAIDSLLMVSRWFDKNDWPTWESTMLTVKVSHPDVSIYVQKKGEPREKMTESISIIFEDYLKFDLSPEDTFRVQVHFPKIISGTRKINDLSLRGIKLKGQSTYHSSHSAIELITDSDIPLMLQAEKDGCIQQYKTPIYGYKTKRHNQSEIRICKKKELTIDYFSELNDSYEVIWGESPALKEYGENYQVFHTFSQDEYEYVDYTLISPEECEIKDSIRIINLFDKEIELVQGEMTAAWGASKYEWFECIDTALVEYEGRRLNRSRGFKPEYKGEFAAVMSNYDKSCIDTTYCISYSPISVEKHEYSKDITLYPNPVKNNLFIEIDHPELFDERSVLITDLVGKILYQSSFLSTETKLNIDMNEFVSGIYLIKIGLHEEQMTYKVIKY